MKDTLIVFALFLKLGGNFFVNRILVPVIKYRPPRVMSNRDGGIR